jgi:hypothetical protein
MCSDGNPDADARPVEVREWDAQAIVWKLGSESSLKNWQQQAALAASDIERGLKPILKTMRVRKAVVYHARVVQFFCMLARDAWSEVEEGRHRQCPVTAATADLCRPSTPFPCDRSIQLGPELGSSCEFQAVYYAKQLCSAFVYG